MDTSVAMTFTAGLLAFASLVTARLSLVFYFHAATKSLRVSVGIALTLIAACLSGLVFADHLPSADLFPYLCAMAVIVGVLPLGFTLPTALSGIYKGQAFQRYWEISVRRSEQS